MASSTTIRLISFVLVSQIFYHGFSEASDGIQRTGIVIRMVPEAEAKALDKDEVTIDGKSYVKQKVANKREVDFDSKNYMGILTGYCEKAMPAQCIDIIVILTLTGFKTDTFVAAATLVKLGDDADFKLGIIEHMEPHSLEFVTVNKQCGVMKDSDTVATITFHDCSQDNFHQYTKSPLPLAHETINIGQNLNHFFNGRT